MYKIPYLDARDLKKVTSKPQNDLKFKYFISRVSRSIDPPRVGLGWVDFLGWGRVYQKVDYVDFIKKGVDFLQIIAQINKIQAKFIIWT